MPWKEPDSGEDGPPDLLELVSSIKRKVKESFRSKGRPSDVEESKELIAEGTHDCAADKRSYFVELYIKCRSCNKTIKKITITKPYKVAALLTVVSYGASQFIEYVVTDNRYPLGVEYAVLDSCVNSYGSVIPYGSYRSKKKICLCALEETMNEISYIRYKVDEDGFLEALRDNAKECK